MVSETLAIELLFIFGNYAENALKVQFIDVILDKISVESWEDVDHHIFSLIKIYLSITTTEIFHVLVNDHEGSIIKHHLNVAIKVWVAFVAIKVLVALVAIKLLVALVAIKV